MEPVSLRHVAHTLFVGDSLAPSTADGDAFVVTLCGYTIDETDVHIPFEDSPDFDSEAFERAVDVVMEQLLDGERVVVHCNAGINRSPAVAATAHCKLSDDSVGQSITKAQCGAHHIAPYFRAEIKRLCGDDGPVEEMEQTDRVVEAIEDDY